MRNDLRDAARNSKRHPWLIITSIGYVLVGIFILMIDSVGAGAILLGLMLWVLFCLLLFVAEKDDYTDQDPYILTKSRVVDRKIEKDSEGDISYYLLLDNGEATQWQWFSKDVYSISDVGTELLRIDCGYIHLQFRYDRENASYWLI